MCPVQEGGYKNSQRSPRRKHFWMRAVWRSSLSGSLLRGLSYVVNCKTFRLQAILHLLSPHQPNAGIFWKKLEYIRLGLTVMISIIGFSGVSVFWKLFAYLGLPCWFVYINRAGEKIRILRFLFSGFIFRDYLASICLHFMWYFTANLPQEKSYKSRKFGLFLSWSPLHSSLIFRCVNQFRRLIAARHTNHSMFSFQSGFYFMFGFYYPIFFGR